MLCPEVVPPINVTSSTEQLRVTVSSTNDYKVVDVSSSNDVRQNVSSNKNRNSQSSNLNKNSPSANQGRSTPKTNQNRGSRLENQNRNSHPKDKKSNLNRAAPTTPKVDSKSKNIVCSTVSSTKSNIKNSKSNHNDYDHGVLISQDASLLSTIDIPLITSSPKKPKRLNLSSPNKDVLSSPNKKLKSSPVETVEGSTSHSNPLTSPDAKKEEKLPDTTVIPDDGETESKLNVRSKSPLTKIDITNPSTEEHKNPPSSHTSLLTSLHASLHTSSPTSLHASLHASSHASLHTSSHASLHTSSHASSHASSHTASAHPSPSQSKSEFHDEAMTSNTTLHDINSIPIKMMSPTSVLPVEATSTIEDDADLDDRVKSGTFSPPANVKKKLKFNNPEFLPQSTQESSSKGTSSTLVEADNPQPYKSMNPLSRLPYKDRNNVLRSSPYFLDVADSDYDQDNESVGGSRNNFLSGSFGDGVERNEEREHDEEHDTHMGYNDVANNSRQMNNFGDNFPNALLNNADGNFINILEGDECEDMYENVPEGDTDSWLDGDQCNDSLMREYDSQSEDVIALDSDDNENEKDDLEFIVCIDSSQKRNRGRLPASLQQSRQPEVVTSQPNRGKITNPRGRRGRPAQRGNRVGNAVTAQTNDQTTNGNLGGNVPPLVHPRLLLNSPQTQADDPTTTPTRKQRGNRRGGGGSRSNKKINKNVEPSPPKNNQQNPIGVSTNAAPAFTTPTRKRARPTIVTSSNNEGHVHTQVTPPQNKTKQHSQTPDLQQHSPSLDSSPSRAILNDRTCTICNHAFANLTLARQHAKQVHVNQYGSPSSGPPSLVCQVCKAMFNTHKDLKSHMLLHGNLNLHKCEVCFRAFKQRSVLAQHILIHSEQLPFACSICDKRFRQQGHLILHLGTHGRNNEGTYTCPHCSIDFTDENSFAEHMREHDAELPFKCNFCQQRFELKSNLMLHLEGHNEGRPFTCHICKKSFKTKTYYFGHMQMHKIRDNQNKTIQTNDFDNMGEGDFIKND